MILVLISVVVIGLFYFCWRLLRSDKAEILQVPQRWKEILQEKVHFYQNLDDPQKAQFESDLKNFLSDVGISGVQTKVTLTDRLLVASSAVIPLFGFPAWTYSHLDEVLLYPSSFDRNFNIGSQEEIITGMVGSGAMEGKVILSKPALHSGFEMTTDKRNVGIHEFVHLFDKEDGVIDGIPPGFNDNTHSIPWLGLIKKKTDEIRRRKNGINEYAAYNQKEFFAVAAEYFFETPHLLKSKEPALYEMLSRIFHQDPHLTIDMESYKIPTTISRNAPCPCGSGVKFKKCCL
ncbi:MAG: zinc-dependent peptidase [Marinoscillum sp.]